MKENLLGEKFGVKKKECGLHILLGGYKCDFLGRDILYVCTLYMDVGGAISPIYWYVLGIVYKCTLDYISWKGYFHNKDSNDFL